MNQVKRAAQKRYLRQKIQSGLIEVKTMRPGRMTKAGKREKEFIVSVHFEPSEPRRIDIEKIRARHRRNASSTPPAPQKLGGKTIRRLRNNT